jgi:Protein of unknown function (DUF1501)
MNRRTFLHAGLLAPIGLGLAGALRLRSVAQAAPQRAAAAKACILLYMTGGAAQHETFDPKPNAPENIRGEFRPIPTNVPGTQICELLPRMAQQAHRYSILRSTFHDSNTHGVGVGYNLTGQHHAPRTVGEPTPDRRDPPCMGSAVRQLRGDRNGLPAAVQLPRPIGDQNSLLWGGQHAGYLGPRFDPLFLFDETWRPGEPMPGFIAPGGVDAQRQFGRMDLLERFRGQQPATAEAERDFERFQQLALDALSSRQAWRAFSLDHEPRPLIERYGDNRFGQSCLVARRLIEAGVGFVTVPWVFKQSEQNFDTHTRNFSKMKDMLLPPVDQAFSALLEDLAQRGLLDETLVAWTGEFGRTPQINRDAGRDHWGRVYSTVLAGGGIRGGQVVGRSDRHGGVPTDNPVHVSDFVATIYHALGYGVETHVTDRLGRPHYIVQGKPVLDLF